MEVSTNHKERGETMEKAKINDYSKMTVDLAQKLPLDGKKDDKGNFTSISLKRGLVKDDGKTYVERRVFKNADMDKVCVYDLELPLTLERAVELFGKDGILDDVWTARRIKTDSEKAGKGGSKPKDPMDILSKLSQALVAKGMSVEEANKLVESNRKALLAAGFGK